MKYMFLFVLFVSALFNVRLPAFPEDEVLSIEDQMRLYRKAYRPFNNSESNFLNTHIPGLIPLIRMGYSYIETLLEKNDEESLSLLKSFWRETKEAINEKKLTPQYFKDTNLRLAFLLNEKQEKSLFLKALDIYTLYSSGNWKNLEQYPFYYKDSISKVQHFPFCFEATLYHPEGELRFEDFFDAYFNDEMMLGLSVIPQVGEGPHRNLVKGSAGFKLHDDTHWGALASGFEENLKACDQIKALMKKIYVSEEKISPFNSAGVFLLLHEFSPAEEYCDYQFSSKEEELVKTGEMPFSERKILGNWINEAAKNVRELSNFSLGSFKNFADKTEFLLIPGLPISLFPTKSECLSNDVYIFDVNLEISLNHTDPESAGGKAISPEQKEENKSDGGMKRIEAIGTAKAQVLFEPTSDRYREKVTVQKFTDISLSPLIELVDRGTLLERLQSLENYSNTAESRLVQYESNFYDLEKIMRFAYGDSTLPLEASAEQIKEKLLEFLSEFYNKHQGLFADTPFQEK